MQPFKLGKSSPNFSGVNLFFETTTENWRQHWEPMGRREMKGGRCYCYTFCKGTIFSPEKLEHFKRKWIYLATAKKIDHYGWWLKSCTSWLVGYSIIYGVLCIPGGAGCLPSTVVNALPVSSMASPICHRPPHEADKGLGGSGLGPKNQLQVGPITYWGYNPSYPNIRQFTGVITPFTTSRGPSCITIKTKHSGEISFSLAQWLAVPITILQEINQEAIFWSSYHFKVRIDRKKTTSEWNFKRNFQTTTISDTVSGWVPGQ